VFVKQAGNTLPRGEQRFKVNPAGAGSILVTKLFLQNSIKKMVTDPIADFLTRIRNAQMARHRIVEIPASNVKKRLTEILYEKGYILKYKFEDDNKQGLIKIALKYDPQTKEPAIKSLERVSRPGLRQYAKPADVRRVQNGLGIAIVSTSKGVMTDKEARTQNVGGEIMCNIY